MRKDKVKIDFSTFSQASRQEGLKYIVAQVTLKEKGYGTGSKNLSALENLINEYARKGYELHTLSTTESHSSGLFGGDRIQATVVFKKI